MAELTSQLRDILPVVGFVCLAMAFLLLVVLYGRERRAAKDAVRDPRQDLTNMMILFQTMRDVVQEQKALARRFNESLDRKVAFVRKIVDEATAERNKLREAHTEMTGVIAEMKRDLARLQRHVGSLKDAAPGEEVENLPLPIEEPVPTNGSAESENGGNGKSSVAPLIACAEPEEPTTGDDLIDNWVGLDLVEKPAVAPESPRLQSRAVEKEKPEEVQAARDAFRSLLDLAEREAAGESGAPGALADAPRAGQNGSNQMANPLHYRVYEYHDAGMTVPQIAHELGMGKGEVRLMLSLRKDRER